MAFHHHEVRGRLPGSGAIMKYDLHFADLLLWLRPQTLRPWFVVRIRTSSHKVGAGSESVNGRRKKNKIIFCDSRLQAKTREF
ncbi:hypothetical protein QWE_16928 [Agrobacterium albertimagni AOL15]|uniref:Uncharacterized protein n=1 Tax=Agrobacterium albertimagni AOL15 TaxID=1156935 RepID=K2QBB5_9HYPH|nr:hypothetical protein QWE_16928 [Agrobacterium albertimagni AOL15]